MLQQPTITNPRRVQMFDLVVKVRIQLTDINHRPLVGFPQEFPALVRHCISAHKQLIIVNLFFHHLKNVTTLLCKMHNFFIWPYILPIRLLGCHSCNKRLSCLVLSCLRNYSGMVLLVGDDIVTSQPIHWSCLGNDVCFWSGNILWSGQTFHSVTRLSWNFFYGLLLVISAVSLESAGSSLTTFVNAVMPVPASFGSWVIK